MSAKQFIGFGKLLTLLLLISCSVSAKDFTVYEVPGKGTVTFNTAEPSFHKNMLQPQTVYLSIANEHSGKPISLGYIALFVNESALSPLKPNRKNNFFPAGCQSV